MIQVSHRGRELRIDGTSVEFEYDLLDAFELNGRVIVLLDPNTYLQDPGYGKERRRGNDPLRNLRAVSMSGDLLWEAEFPEAVDYYYKIVDRNPLTALSFSSFRCAIDAATGVITRKEFYK
jgi:hypothetical protein